MTHPSDPGFFDRFVAVDKGSAAPFDELEVFSEDAQAFPEHEDSRPADADAGKGRFSPRFAGHWCS